MLISGIKAIVSKKIKGGALYISILVSILIGVTLTLFILLTNYNQRNITVFCQSSQLNYNLKSALQMAQSAYFTTEQNYTWIKNQVNEDSVRIKKINWGAYIIISAETKNRHQYLSQAALYGTFMTADTGLMVSDNSRPVGLSGNIVFKSACYLPVPGIKPTYMEGQSYMSSPQNSALTRKSFGKIPLVNSELLKGIQSQFNSFDPRLDSSVRTLKETCNQSFINKTISWENSSIHLSRFHLRNNIKLICEDVEIDSTNHFENILIVCKKVRFKKGFRGKVHVIASDSINMEEECTFDYPSSFVLIPYKETNGSFNYIQFNKGCVFFGGILALHKLQKSSPTVFVKFHSKSEINGFVYSSDYVHLEGMINATVIADKLLIKTSSAVYENQLLGCEINPKKYAALLVMPLVFKQNSKLLCCEKVN